MHALVVAIVFAGLLPAAALAYSCAGRPFSEVRVFVDFPYVGNLAQYSISARLPGFAGCRLSTSTEIAVVLPLGTEVSATTQGWVNGVPVSAWIAREHDRLAFLSPLVLPPGSSVSIALRDIRNTWGAGARVIVLSVLIGDSNRMGPTLAAAFTIFPAVGGGPMPTVVPESPRDVDAQGYRCLPEGGSARANCLLE
ncbi:MAG: hypothetical protein N3C12_05645 [Candidatus Binatia bacterium]|nr:hypothetical protein [Candidatus Binatia bacterium]